MADLQKQFEDLHKSIRLRNKSEKAKLQDKRDLLISNLKDGLKQQAAESGEKKLTFKSFNQGSYAMHTGIKPKDSDYDIDIGIIFDNTQDDFDNPVELKKKVRDALKSGTRKIAIRRPCVTVTYYKNDKPDYHVDLAIYVNIDGESCYEIAKGKEHTAEENQEWQKSDPKGLIEKINNCHSNEEDRKQYKRTIRYLKRWRDKQFPNGGAPISIGLTCAAYHWFSPVKSIGIYNDLRSLENLVGEMLSEFTLFTNRLEVELPVTPNNNLFESMSDKQMEIFKDKLQNLKDSLQSARYDESKTDACKTLQKQFGDDFPSYEEEENKAKTSYRKPVVTTGMSA